MSGATRRRTRYVPPGAGAAMEPARDERGDRGAGQRPPSGVDAAMEPARDERGDRHGRYGAYSAVNAAMEPARDERGDSSCPAWCCGGRGAAMEPARDERGDSPARSRTRPLTPPQWSSLAMSGATYVPGPEPRYPDDAAMEPARDERGDASHALRQGRRRRAAMEPARDERGDRARGSARECSATLPQWSPLAMSGATAATTRPGPPSRGRNGARSR